MQTETHTATTPSKATKARPIETDEITLRSEAHKALKAAADDQDRAFDLMWTKITNDISLYRALADEMMEKAIKAELWSIIASRRNSTFAGARSTFTNITPTHAPSQAASLRALDKAEERRLMDMTIIKGKTLGECTGKDLDTAIERRTAIVATIGKNRAFLVALRQKVGDTERCAAKFNEGDLRQILAATDANFDAEARVSDDLEGGADV